MGKIILTERQYRNLNQILIGKEIENNKGRLNEAMTEDQQLEAKSVGLRINNILSKCNGGVIFAKTCTDAMNVELSALTTKDQFDEASKFTSYWVDSRYTPDQKWATNLGHFLKQSGHDNPLPEATKFATYFAKAGGNLTFKKDANLDGLVFKPMSFNLTWPAAAPAAATSNLNWGGNTTDTDKYWNILLEKLKPYGAKLDGGSANGGAGPFIWWGNDYIMKNYLNNGGYNIVINGARWKFAAYGGKYAGQPLESITLTPQSGGEIEKLLTLLGTKKSGTEEKKDKKVYDKTVVGGGGKGGSSTGGGGTGGGGTGGGGTGGGGSPFGGQYSDYF